MVAVSLDEIRTRFTRIDSQGFSVRCHQVGADPIEIRLIDGGTDSERWVVGEEEVEAPDLEAALIVAMEMSGRG